MEHRLGAAWLLGTLGVAAACALLGGPLGTRLVNSDALWANHCVQNGTVVTGAACYTGEGVTRGGFAGALLQTWLLPLGSSGQPDTSECGSVFKLSQSGEAC